MSDTKNKTSSRRAPRSRRAPGYDSGSSQKSGASTGPVIGEKKTKKNPENLSFRAISSSGNSVPPRHRSRKRTDAVPPQNVAYADFLAPRRRWPFVLLAVAIGLAVVYIALSLFYSGHFLPNTNIAGIAASGLTAESVKEKVQEATSGYSLTITGRNGITQTIHGADVGYSYDDNGEIERLLEEQNSWTWPAALFRTDRDTDVEAVTYDQTLMESCVDTLEFFDSDVAVMPTDASIAEDPNTQSTMIIVPETEGSYPDREKVIASVSSAFENNIHELDLDASDCYLKPAVYSDDATLNSRLASWNTLLSSIGLTYDFGDRQEVFDRDTIVSLATDNGRVVSIDRTKVENLVQEWKNKYDTFGLEREFTTHYGETITIEAGGDYGWVIKKAETATQIMDDLQAGTVSHREPVYLYTAMSRNTDDIGGTYVEISLSEQMMWMYKDYECIVETPVVTGQPDEGNETHKGCFAIDAKKSPSTLTGETWNSEVTYWMPFNGNEGIHDADRWRTEYGGSIYLYNGSHGCVNTPYSKAETIYNNVEIGTAVIVY